MYELKKSGFGKPVKTTYRVGYVIDKDMFYEKE